MEVTNQADIMPLLIPLPLLFGVLGIIASTEGHGRMIEPPSRASMFRFNFNNPPNYNDNQLFCGGFYTQWTVYGGKCGVCGDSFGGPREHEAPTGKYAKGSVVRKYEVGQEILVRIHLTANHKGWFEFRLCQNDVKGKNVTQECFDKYLLKDKSGRSRFPIVSRGPEFPSYNLTLPAGLKCAACVLQWKYNTGNSWGNDFITGKGCIGCGPQEQFYACADIAVGRDDIEMERPDKPVIVPPGDVDERTAWADEAAKEAEREKDNCKCTCPQTASAGNWQKGLPMYAIALISMANMLQL